MSQVRNACFTLNNWTPGEYQTIEKLDVKYMVVGKEIGENGTPHLQGYVEFKTAKRFTTLKKLNARIHWEARKGTAEQAAEYCKKDGDFIEIGEISKQGKRTDLDELKKTIVAGTKVDDIVMESPMLYHQYGRTLNKIEDLAMRKRFRTEMTQGIWYWGETGAGKSHKAFEGFTPETHYVYTNDGGWWDGYTQQETVIINDFRGQIPYGELLNLVDKWPHSVRRRNREPIPFTSKKVIITSALKPEEIYCNLSQNDSLEQLKRRFNVVEIVADVTEVVGGNTRTPPVTIPKRPDNIEW